MIEEISSHDDALMEKYLGGEELTEAEIKAAIRKAPSTSISSRLFVVLRFKNKGVQNLLDAVVDYMPSPLDIPAIKGIDPIPVKRLSVKLTIASRSRPWPSRS